MSSPSSHIDLEEEEVDYENMSINSDVEEGGDATYVSSNSDMEEEEEVASEYEYDGSSDDEGGAFQFQLPYQSLYNQELISCPICCEEKIEEGCSLILILPKCRHSFCVECFNKHIEMVVGQGNADNIKCPFNIESADGDDNMIGHSQCCNEAVAMEVLREVLDKESFKRLMDQKNAAFVLKNPDYHHCPTPDCSGIVLCPFVDMTVNNRDSGDALGHQLPSVSAAAAPPRICDCFRCGKTSCLSCGASPFHEGLTCAQHQRELQQQQQNKAANIIRDAYLQYRRRAAPAADPTEELLQRRGFVSEMRRRFRMRFSTFDRSRDREETKYEFELDTTEATMLGITSTSTPKEREVGFFSTFERTILVNGSFSTIKRCRRCGNGIERVSGCLHMTCRCGYEFCFKCGSDSHYACTG
jgi:hypothetical protein